jgi:hypothetical protein
MKFAHLKVGDKVIRMLGGEVAMPLVVTEVADSYVVCQAWQFDKATGAEIDDDLDWGPPPKWTWSFLKLPT